MSDILVVSCKDCGEPFTYTTEAAESDRRRGRTPPERCARCRTAHRKEYSTLGVSHNDVVQIRSDGSGGLARYVRDRPATQVRPTQRLKIDPMPIESIIGAADQAGTILHGLLTAPQRVHIVVGPTGSGKSTWLPFRLLTCDELTARGPIVITQPRIPATEGPAKFVGKMYYGDGVEPVVGPGLAVGYRYGEIGDTMTDASNRLVFMTDGTLLNWIRDDSVRRCSLVIVDEAHERSLNIDKILALLKRKLKDLPHLQIMISSATVDATTFQTFFGGAAQAAVYESRGFTYPILDIFVDESVAHLSNRDFERISATDTGWSAVDDKTRAESLLGAHCLSHRAVTATALRYYPAFETLVYSGVMTGDVRQALSECVAEEVWQRVVSALFESSHRKRVLDGGREVLLDQPIRATLGVRTNKNGPTDASRLRPSMIRTVADHVISLVERDEHEAPRRLARWHERQRWQTHRWDDLGSDGWSRLRQPLGVGHILAFLPTSADINKCAELVGRALKSRDLDRRNVVVRFFREAPDDEKKLATSDTSRSDPNPVRRIVIGSNLAETSLTLDGLAYVVDGGLICEEYFDPAKGGKTLPTIIHSQAGCRQRVGRVGRKEPGEAYRLYTREELREQPPFTTPEVARKSAGGLILDLVRAGVGANVDEVSASLMNPPKREELSRAGRELDRFGAIDSDGDVTHRGAELASVQAESFSAAQLLLEADRFGVLWEMAIFQAFCEIKDTDGAGRKWFGLFGRPDEPVYDDADVDLDDEGNGGAGGGRTAFDDPYVAADALLKRRVLGEGCLDDLEFYLRVWQGWHSTPSDERRLWAHTHGVSHQVLLKVEAALGFGDSPNGTLRQFWAFDQKGQISRDVDFSRLALVRFLYAAGHPDCVYRRKADGTSFERLSDGRQSGAPHRDSVWTTHTDGVVESFGRVLARRCCAATSRPGFKGAVLSHLVWLDEAWLNDGPPGFGETSLALARRFSPEADRIRAFAGEAPFLTGASAAGFQWPMPAVARPSPLQVEQWTRLYAGCALISAVVKLTVNDPAFSPRRLAFAQISHGPLVPIETAAQDGQFPEPGATYELRLVPRDGLLWGQIAADPAATGAQTPAPGPGGAEPAVPAPAVRIPLAFAAPPAAGVGRADIPAKPAQPPVERPIAPVPMWPPVGAIVAAIVADVEDDPSFYGFRVVVDDGQRKADVRVACQLPIEALRREARVGRALQVRITGRRGETPAGQIESWADAQPPMMLPKAWPIGTQLDAELVGPHKTRPYQRLVRVTWGRTSCTWAAMAHQNAPLDRGRRVRVVITKWVTDAESPWPQLRVVEWL